MLQLLLLQFYSYDNNTYTIIFEGDMLFDQPDIGNYQPDIVQKGPSEGRVVLNHGETMLFPLAEGRR